MRILVAIANYGESNQQFLRQLTESYAEMEASVHVVVLSDRPKRLGTSIEVLVGIPTRNPWSLPFRHRRLFAERLNEYDLFIYSEDDTLIEEKNVKAFLEVTEVLPDTCVPGFLRYEIGPRGERYISSVHNHYHWIPESRFVRGSYTFAQFTNAHSATYILTRQQLVQAIQSGGFLVEPHEGPYDMLCSAATDPYTRCGLTKVICLSRIQDFLLHHLPNKYIGTLGLPEDQFMKQVRALIQAREDELEAKILPSIVENPRFVTFYETQEYRRFIGENFPNVRKVLSVGRGCGTSEASLISKGVEVAGIPLDPLMGVLASASGVTVLPAEISGAIEVLRRHGCQRSFDCLFIRDYVFESGMESTFAPLMPFLLPDAHLVILSSRATYAHLIRRSIKQREWMATVKQLVQLLYSFVWEVRLRFWFWRRGYSVVKSAFQPEGRPRWLPEIITNLASRRVLRHVRANR